MKNAIQINNNALTLVHSLDCLPWSRWLLTYLITGIAVLAFPSPGSAQCTQICDPAYNTAFGVG